MMAVQRLIGTWTLRTCDNFDAFLEHLNYGWLARKAAKLSSIEIVIEAIANESNALMRRVRSTFFNTEERYDLDDVARTNDDGVNKRHRMVDGTLITVANSTVANGTVADWKEAIDVRGDEMTVRRTWTQDGTQHTCIQRFERQ